MNSYDARKETIIYYSEYCHLAALSITPKQLLAQDIKRATTTTGIFIWAPNLVFLAWEIDGKTLWIEHAIGYLADIRSLAESYGPKWTVSYKHRNKIRTQNMHRLLEKL